LFILYLKQPDADISRNLTELKSNIIDTMKNLLLLSPLFLLASCAQKIVDFALNENGILDETTVLRSIKYADKEIVFLDMMHLGKKTMQM